MRIASPVFALAAVATAVAGLLANPAVADEAASEGSSGASQQSLPQQSGTLSSGSRTVDPRAAAAQALINAAKHRDSARALALINEGADVNATEVDGTTALMWAAYYGDADVVAALLSAGADATPHNDYGVSALSEAAIAADTAVIRLLLEAGADPDSPTPEGQTALMAVARTGNVQAAELLIRAGADVNAREEWGGQSALMWAAAQSQPAMIALLIEHGAEVDARGAIRDWQRKVTAEPRPKDMNRGGFTPLLYAAREGCIACAHELLAGGADINLSDPERVSPLNLALINQNFDFAAYIIEAGADVDRWDFFGRSPLYNAVDMNTLPALGNREGGRNDIPSADATTPLEIVAMLLAAGANPNLQLKLRPPYRNVPFDRGADPLLGTGATPLLRAAQAADIEAIRLLLAAEALVDLPNANGFTPLMAAAGMGIGNRPSRGVFRTVDDGVIAVDMLVAAGADINATANNGRTAAHGPAMMGWNPLIRALHRHGADFTVADNQGRTPLDLARGDFQAGFLESPPEPREATIALLEELLAD
jgi:uncharacterized protein